MSRFAVVLLLLAVSGLLLRPAAAQAKPRVVVSVPVLGLVARELGGAQIDVHQLLQGDASPHDYAMKFSDRKALQQADRVFWIAPALESFLAAPLLAHKNAVVLFASLPESEAHIWFAPQLMRDSARVMAQHFAVLAPADAALFEARLARFETRLTAAGQMLSTRLQPLAGITLVVGHDAYTQLTRNNALPPVLAVLQQIQTTASARRIATLEQNISAGGRFCVIEERNHPLPVARRLAQRHQLPLVAIDVYAARAASYGDWLDQLGYALAGCGAIKNGALSAP